MGKPFGEPILDCPHCQRPIGDKHPYQWCAECGEPLPADVLARLGIGTKPGTAQADQLSRVTTPGVPIMKTLAYAIWLFVSLVVLAVLRNIVRSEYPNNAGIIMGVAFAAVAYGFFEIRGHFSGSQRSSSK